MGEKILVLGNSNVDFVFRIPRFHDPGETILAESLETFFGGKGANQAITAKRLGGDVQLITKVGNDHYGKVYRHHLIKSGLDGKLILEDKKLSTGTAAIELTTMGQNRIVAFLGANGSLSVTDLKQLERYWRGVKVFVTQLEIPLETVERGLRKAKDQGALTLLNPSPPTQLPSKILALVDFIVPNEVEAQLLTGIKWNPTGRARGTIYSPPSPKDGYGETSARGSGFHLAEARLRLPPRAKPVVPGGGGWKGDRDIKRMATRLLDRGVKNVVITLGAKGLFFKNRNEELWMKAFRVNVVDTTAAGDAFLGGLAAALSEGKPVQEALKFANGAGALATTKLGAQPSLPSRKELGSFLKKHMQK